MSSGSQTPDDAEEAARRLAYAMVAPLWCRYGMSRAAVYRWLAAILGVDDVSITMLSREQCERVIARVELLLSKVGGY